MKKLLMIVGMMLAAASAPVWAAEEMAKPAPATIAWGEAVSEVQAGLVPLGGTTGWKGFLCPDHTSGIAKHAMSDEMAARKRCCRVCGAPKPWSATFSEGEPMRMELHVRNLAKEERSLCNAGVRNAPAVCREWHFTFTPAGDGTSWTPFWPVKATVPPESDLKLGVGDQNEAVLEQHLGGGHWIFADRQGRRISSLPAGKYTVTASYEHTEHEPAKAPIPVSPGAAAEMAARQAARPGGENPAAKPCPYWHGTVTTAPVEIEVLSKNAKPAAEDGEAGNGAVDEAAARRLMLKWIKDNNREADWGVPPITVEEIQVRPDPNLPNLWQAYVVFKKGGSFALHIEKTTGRIWLPMD